MNEFDFDHARRVAARVNGNDARLVAFLHDAVEDGNVTPALMNETLGEGSVLDAVRLLTRPSTVSYPDYIDRIYQADGYAGVLARQVKIADLTENLERMDDAHESLRPRYLVALARLRTRPAVLVRPT